MSYNGAGVFQINSTGQPVVNGTVISASVFNALTTDIASGLTNCITKDGQQTVTANIPMGGFKFTGMASGSSSTDSARIDNCNVLNMCEFRLTGTSGVPVTTSDVTAIETLYFTPYKGNRIALYDGSKWLMRTAVEVSIDVPDATNMYDVFIYETFGLLGTELVAWSTTTARATALTTQDGVLVKSGDATRRYVGSFYCTTAGNGQTEDSVANRYIWNYYNRVPRLMRVLELTDSWTYSSATIRQANGSTANQLNFVMGWAEDHVTAEICARAANSSGSVEGFSVGVGLDTTSAFSSGNIIDGPQKQVQNTAIGTHARYKGYPGVGKHFLSWNEGCQNGNATTTWYGDNASSYVQSGIIGEVLA